ncbi:hypothetical protein FZ103_09460 [Streptomonospora sp. PA3]|uniref:hypothetical protein n=1 Tax=Streptomonospora sp. PA3 TaxID=2607326 RepID=UPI0012DD98B3|nr:hypothetical protein [Streptomonospora sp. PA3]MUL41402.1 hypothetical protein [Streptomonospora sp. PA3]
MNELLSRLTDPLILLPLVYIACAIPFMFTPTWRLLRSSIYSQESASSANMWVVRLCLMSTCTMAAVFVVMSL